MMKLQTVKYNSDYYKQLVDIRQDILRRPLGFPITDDELERESEDIFIAAIEHEEVIGCCILTRLSETKVQLRQMVVLPAIQGRGLGRDLISHAEEVARENGYTHLCLHARKVVLEFYLKQSYQIDGDGFVEVGISHYMMSKVL